MGRHKVNPIARVFRAERALLDRSVERYFHLFESASVLQLGHHRRPPALRTIFLS